LAALATPVVFGVAAPFMGYIAALLVGALTACLLPEWILWRTRMRARATFAGRPGVFCGFSPSAAPRIYDGSLDYDWGFAAFEGDSLAFRGDRTTWAASRFEIESIGVADGPFGWLARPVVCFRLRSGLTLCLRPFDRSFGPAATKAAFRLLSQATQWHATATPRSDVASTLDFSSVQGQTPPQYSWRALLRALPRYAGITLITHWVILTLLGRADWIDLSHLFGPAGVTCVLAIFLAYPNLRRGRHTRLSPSTPLASTQPDR